MRALRGMQVKYQLILRKPALNCMGKYLRFFGKREKLGNKFTMQVRVHDHANLFCRYLTVNNAALLRIPASGREDLKIRVFV